jgi:hypothetical protein
VGIGFSRGRILMGKRLYKDTTSNEIFKKYTLIVAINNNKTVKWKLYKKGGIDTLRLIEFLKELLKNTKNKLIILDNASSHRNDKIKELVNKNNKLLYAVPYQHFTNSIENYFSMMKARLRKIEGLTHSEIKQNISNVIRNIPKEKYENIFKGAYNRNAVYVKNKTRKNKSKKYLK